MSEAIDRLRSACQRALVPIGPGGDAHHVSATSRKEPRTRAPRPASARRGADARPQELTAGGPCPSADRLRVGAGGPAAGLRRRRPPHRGGSPACSWTTGSSSATRRAARRWTSAGASARRSAASTRRCGADRHRRSGGSCDVPPAGFEPAPLPPEGSALSPELRGLRTAEDATSRRPSGVASGRSPTRCSVAADAEQPGPRPRGRRRRRHPSADHRQPRARGLRRRRPPSTARTASTRSRTSRPDVITLDIMMPRLDGWEAASRLRADPETAGIKVVLLSARAQEADLASAATGSASTPTSPSRSTPTSSSTSYAGWPACPRRLTGYLGTARPRSGLTAPAGSRPGGARRSARRRPAPSSGPVVVLPTQAAPLLRRLRAVGVGVEELSTRSSSALSTDRRAAPGRQADRALLPG